MGEPGNTEKTEKRRPWLWGQWIHTETLSHSLETPSLQEQKCNRLTWCKGFTSLVLLSLYSYRKILATVKTKPFFMSLYCTGRYFMPMREMHRLLLALSTHLHVGSLAWPGHKFTWVLTQDRTWTCSYILSVAEKDVSSVTSSRGITSWPPTSHFLRSEETAFSLSHSLASLWPAISQESEWWWFSFSSSWALRFSFSLRSISRLLWNSYTLVSVLLHRSLTESLKTVLTETALLLFCISSEVSWVSVKLPSFKHKTVEE